MLHISSNIKLIRELLGENQTKFGKRFGATKAMIVSYESGKATPGNLFQERLSKMIGLPLTILLEKRLTEEEIDKRKLEKLEEGIVKKETSQASQADPTSQLLTDLVHTNRNLSESNKSLALSHEELVGMVKKDSTSDEARYTMEETVAMVLGLREYLAEIAAYVKKMPPQEVLQEIHSKVKVARVKAGKKGSPSEAGK